MYDSDWAHAVPAKIVANAAQRAALQARRGSLFADMTPPADDSRRSSAGEVESFHEES
jgi:hypothetical protein